MHQSPIFQAPCKDGTLFVDQMNIFVVTIFNKTLWSIPRTSVKGIKQLPSFIKVGIEIYSSQGFFSVKALTEEEARDLVALLSLPLPPTPPPQGIPIDAEIQRVKLEIEQYRLELSQINVNMSSVRARYQQNHYHGSGLYATMRAGQRKKADRKLRKQQPIKEQLQWEKLALEHELLRLKTLKTQGVSIVSSSQAPQSSPQYLQPQQYMNSFPSIKPPIFVRFASWYRVQPRPRQIIVAIAIITSVIFVGSAVVTGVIRSVQESTPLPTIQAPIGQQTSAPTPINQPTSTPTLPPYFTESITFQGDISGKLTQGINPQPLTHENPTPAYVQRSDGSFFNPAPTMTQCSDFDSGVGQDSVAVIVGKVGTMQYAVTIEINEDDPAYTKPGTELRPGNINSGGSVEVYEMGGKNRRWQQVYGPAQQDTVIVLHSDRTSGTVDAWMATTDQSQKIADSTLHIQGNWRCG